ncbi:MAG TPA: DUF3604 domain-containing protein, partial [Candidatus Binatia bacterium]|nr:DUF3604 domain-containing protein [Candidatus Binatia bacterium]
SFDAYNFGTRTDPAQSYAFATGAAVDIGLGYEAKKGEVPGPLGVTISFSGGRLDFGAVTDHSEFLASDYGCSVDGASPFYGSPVCGVGDNLKKATLPCAGFSDVNVTGCLAEQTKAWAAENQATEAANDPCTFTSFHAYEWTYSLGPDASDGSKQTLHKNVFFRNAIVPTVPVDSFDYPGGPALWAALASQCNDSTGCEALTIPHNMNQSNGLAFVIDGFTATDLNRMLKYQRLVEIHQHKANSECLTDTVDGGATVACDFEVNPALTQPVDAPGYARAAMKDGLSRFVTRGYDPFAFGFVGATDNHDGTMGNVGEATWPGFIGAQDNTAVRRLTRNPFKTNPGGITGIWAEENTREALWAALRRRETFATSGPKIRVRFYEYTGSGNPCADPRFPAQVVNDGGVPMGGTMRYAGAAPRFVVYALQDQTPLASVDIVKGAYAGGAAQETVYPIPFAGTPACVTWTDPAFDPSEPAFYYARVKEQPTWRWSHYDCERLKQSYPIAWQTLAPGCASSDPTTGGLDFMIQERAWTSAIWYLPGGPVTVQASTLTLRDGSASADPAKRRFAFQSRTRKDSADHRIVVPPSGSTGDPTAAGAGGGGGTLAVYNPESGERVTVSLPATRWHLAGSGKAYTFSDPHGPVQKVRVGNDELSIKAGKSGWGFTLDEPRQGRIAVRLQLGTAEPWCSEASAKLTGKPATSAKNDRVDRFIGQAKTPPPEQCPLLASPSGAFL